MEAVRLVAATRGNAKTLYLHAGGKLSFDPPAVGQNSYDEYVSDAAVPVPFVPYATTEPISKYLSEPFEVADHKRLDEEMTDVHEPEPFARR